jgi:thiosulfate dehydrogenase
MDKREQEKYAEQILRLMQLIVFLVFVIIGVGIWLVGSYQHQNDPATLLQSTIEPDSNGLFTEAAREAYRLKLADSVKYWQAPEQVPDNLKSQINYGKELIIHTSHYFGPRGRIKPNATNGMDCQNCHLEAGTKTFGNNYASVYATYPKYRARSGSIENIYKRVNDCFERSLNGATLDTTSREMQAIKAYINWLGSNVKKGQKAKGAGLRVPKFLNRAADTLLGRKVYVAKCQSCHQADGQGKMDTEDVSFIYPPLWGSRSFNSGAGLYRLSNLAAFAHDNMPQGVSFKQTQLSDEDAWDVAAFINSKPRPTKDISKDWPKLHEKPFDHPFGPYKDGFSELQHKYGPFQPIKEKWMELKKTS